VEVVPLLSQGRTAAAQCGLFTHKSVPVIFEPPCILNLRKSECYDIICAVLMTVCKNVPTRACASVRAQQRDNCWKHVHKVSFWRVPLRFVNTFQFTQISRKRKYVPTRISKFTP